MFDWFLDPPEKVDPFRPAIIGLASASLVNSFIWMAVWVWTREQSTTSFAFATAFATAAWLVRGSAATTGRAPEKFEDKPKQGETHCKDCGKPFELRQTQKGFDPATGEPVLSFQLGCVDGDPGRSSKEYEQYIADYRSSMYSMTFRGQRYCWPHCGETTVTPLLPVNHQHPVEETNTDCPACIQDMLAQRIITVDDAHRLLAELGHER